MQRGLINHRAGKEGVTIFFKRDGQTIKPFRPLAVQVTFKSDPVDPWRMRVCYKIAFVRFLHSSNITTGWDYCHASKELSGDYLLVNENEKADS